ncbi:MAG: PTS transporter subunit EIIC [Selenomonadaceae bacterium]|nr:PTS transporter subunit EIIC [Selenomonadaceae bacterium]
MSNEEFVKKIIETLGGTENISSVTNCMTRLRVHLIKQDKNIFDELKKIEGVLGTNQDGEELQIILGPGKVTKTADAVKEILKKSSPKIGDGKELHEKIREKNSTPIKLFLKKIASIFIPLIPGFIACGLITGLVGCALKISPELANEPVIKLLMVAGNSVFWGMNLFIGWNAGKVFGGTPIIGGVLAALITHPALAEINFFGENLVPGRGGIISVVLIAAFAVQLEKIFHKIIPEIFDLFLTPLLTVLTAGAAAIFILQPVGGIIADGIGNFAAGAVESGGALTGFILAGFWLPLVMFGVHQAFTPIHVSLISQYGMTILLPILAMAGAGQVGAAVAVYFKTKNKFLKKTVASALPVGMMGVGEPLIYGVTFPLGKPFIGACIGGAFGGAVQANFSVGAAALGISGLPLAATTNNALIYLAGVLVAYVAGFIATWILGFEDPPEENI